MKYEMDEKHIDYKALYHNLYDKYTDKCIEISRLQTTIKTLMRMFVMQEDIVESGRTEDY